MPGAHSWGAYRAGRLPEAGLRLVNEIGAADALRHYAPLPAARGDFLFRAGPLAEVSEALVGKSEAAGDEGLIRAAG